MHNTRLIIHTQNTLIPFVRRTVDVFYQARFEHAEVKTPLDAALSLLHLLLSDHVFRYNHRAGVTRQVFQSLLEKNEIHRKPLLLFKEDHHTFSNRIQWWVKNLSLVIKRSAL